LAENESNDDRAQPDDGTLDVDLRAIASALPARIDATPEGVEQGLAKLVLTIIEVLRKVLEHQAVRRMDGGSLSDDEVERLGLALLSLDGRLRELKTVFGLSDEELEIDLGPLGRLR
jgi:actin-like ATPase involved in cell morphogenesis